MSFSSDLRNVVTVRVVIQVADADQITCFTTIRRIADGHGNFLEQRFVRNGRDQYLTRHIRPGSAHIGDVIRREVEAIRPEEIKSSFVP